LIKRGLNCDGFLKGEGETLPRHVGGVFEIVSETKIELRDDYNTENSVSDPRTTPEEQSVTEILIATV